MSHYYTKDGKPMHWVPRADGKGTRPTTIADARKLGLVPSVTTILAVLSKPGLQNWITQQHVLAVVTAPDVPGEGLDAKIERILNIACEQDEEAATARNLGTDIHSGLQSLFSGGQIHDDLRPWIEPVYLELRKVCVKTLATEIILVGDGYAGMADLIADSGDDGEIIVDFKSCKKLPTKGAWPEHRLQLAAYARTRRSISRMIRTMNVYISTVDCGKFAIFMNPPWPLDYEDGFAPLVRHWQWANRLNGQPAEISI